MDPTLLLLVLFFMISLGVAAVMMLVRDAQSARAAALEHRLPSEESLLQPLHGNAPGGSGVTGGIDQFFYRLVSESGMPFSPVVGFQMAVAAGLIIGGGVFLWREDIYLSIGAFLLGAIITVFIFMYLRVRRLRKIREQLPGVVDMIARSVRAGESLDQAIANVGEASAPPLGDDLRRCARQLEMGLSMDSAMQVLINRAPINETRILAATMVVQRRAGGNLPVTLERLARVIRDRLSYYRQFRAATAAARAGALLIALAGPIAFLFLLWVEPEYVSTLFEVHLGRVLLGVAIVLQVVGMIWIFSLLRIDY